MVTRLPQQVLLLLILVTIATTKQAKTSREIIKKTDLESVNGPATSLSLLFNNSSDWSLRNNEEDTWNKNPGSVTSTMKTSVTIRFGRTGADATSKSQKTGSYNDSHESDIRVNSGVIDRAHPSITTMKHTDPSGMEKRAVINVKTRRPTSDQITLRSVSVEALTFILSTNQHTTSHIMENTALITQDQRTDASFPSSTEVQFLSRQIRDSDPCYKFKVGDDSKQEFYSPGYPGLYPNHLDCYRVLEASPGMLIKLDFRDYFMMEGENCMYDYLEVRDGQHGFENLLGRYCGKNFPPEITSKSRYLWLRFHSDESIEDKGFRAVWTMIPRPTYPGVLPEPEPCMKNVTDKWEWLIRSQDVEDRKKDAEKTGMALDCMWVITVPKGWKIQLTFPSFGLAKPNECDANFVDVFSDRTDISSRLRCFCGSIAELVTTKSNVAHIRFYAEPKAINSTFMAVMTAIRDKDKECTAEEYDCEDACIAAELRCNGRDNCRYRFDEDENTCGSEKRSLMLDSEHIIIILVVFSIIMFGLCFAFVFNCVKKLIRDHRIIKEHIKQSRENRLDEIGRKATPCPNAKSDSECQSESSLEAMPSRELGITTTTITAQEYGKDMILEMNSKDLHDIHQSNNVSNATQERLQESIEEPEMRDNACQTRESLFDPKYISDSVMMQPSFTTFGFRSDGSSSQSRQTNSVQQCSSCNPSIREVEVIGAPCPKHNCMVVPAPPGWQSGHEYSPYPMPASVQTEVQLDSERYQPSFYQSPSNKPSLSSSYGYPVKGTRSGAGSGERYGSSLYGSSKGSNNTNSSSQKSSMDPRYRAEAIIEMDQKRPFSIESTKSAPDVIATH